MEEGLVGRHTVARRRLGHTMQITLYRRSYPVAGAPVSWSLVPDSVDQRHTFTVGGKVYEAERREVQIVVPSDAKIDALKNLLCWGGDKGVVKSTAREVYELAEAGASGFRVA
jgi:hypothetical protein